MGVPPNEQETVIGFDRYDDMAEIYTSDTTMMHKFDKYVKSSPDWELTNTYYLDGEIVGKIYKIPRKLVSFRSKTTKRTMTEEQRKAAAERLKKARSKDEQKETD